MMQSLRPTAAAKAIGIVYAFGLACLAIRGAIDAPDALFVAPFFWAWQVGPALISAVLVKAARTRAGAWLLVIAEALIVVSTAWLLVDMQVNREQWTAAGAAMLLALYGPFYQYVAVIVIFALASLLGWRAREEWLDA